MFNYLKCLIIFILTYKARANKFIVLANEDSFFQPCDSLDNGGNTNIGDLAEFNLVHNYAEDMETLITNGNITIKIGIPEDVPVNLNLEIYEWKRGKWEKTIYSIKRPDICKFLFDPSELWYALSMQIPEQDRDCPPKKGRNYHLENMLNRIELPNIVGVDLEGKYKIVTLLTAGEYSTCLTSIVNIWKD